jgi:hypothetical protein
MMSRVVLVSAFGLSGVLLSFIAQGCSSSSSPAASNDAGASEDTGVSTVVTDTGTGTPSPDTGTGTPPKGDAGTLVPSNVPSSTLTGLVGISLDIGSNDDGGTNGNNCSANTDTGAWACNGVDPAVAGNTFTQTGAGGNARVWVFSSLTIEPGATLEITGAKPAIIVASTVSISGAITSEAGQQSESGSGPNNTESGGACANGSAAGLGTGGGGGAFCGTGGSGASGDAGTVAAGGVAYGTASLIPLLAGGAGGYCNGGGNGGGAVQISAYGSFVLLSGASISVNGSAGNQEYVGGGAGAGGAILIESPSVSIAGTLAANGGSGADSTANGSDGPISATGVGGGGAAGGAGSGGATVNGANGIFVNTAGPDVGGGGGGAGWIRINTSGMPTLSGAVISPAATTSCYSVGAL